MYKIRTVQYVHRSSEPGKYSYKRKKKSLRESLSQNMASLFRELAKVKKKQTDSHRPVLELSRADFYSRSKPAPPGPLLINCESGRESESRMISAWSTRPLRLFSNAHLEGGLRTSGIRASFLPTELSARSLSLFTLSKQNKTKQTQFVYNWT